MGSCLGSQRSRNNHYGGSIYPAIGKNQPLQKEHPKWKSEVPMTEGQLRSRRDEFWDTSPAYGGQKVIWDALRAAVTALENSDLQLAQAIIDGANITLPHGSLLDCYDELGEQYQLPAYCLSAPTNLIKETVSTLNTASVEIPEIKADDPNIKQIRIRLASEREIKLTLLSSDTIAIGKRRLNQKEDLPASKQRWFFSGKLLVDTMRVEQYKLEKGFVVQCVMSEQS